LAGEVVGECLPRHRAKEFIKFLKRIDTAVDKILDVHRIIDNYSTHKTKAAQNWQDRGRYATSWHISYRNDGLTGVFRTKLLPASSNVSVS
jgi:hypothetical protein